MWKENHDKTQKIKSPVTSHLSETQDFTSTKGMSHQLGLV
jgi:hypothetical protein